MQGRPKLNAAYFPTTAIRVFDKDTRKWTLIWLSFAESSVCVHRRLFLQNTLTPEKRLLT
jgi:hypothetical protein